MALSLTGAWGRRLTRLALAVGLLLLVAAPVMRFWVTPVLAQSPEVPGGDGFLTHVSTGTITTLFDLETAESTAIEPIPVTRTESTRGDRGGRAGGRGRRSECGGDQHDGSHRDDRRPPDRRVRVPARGGSAHPGARRLLRCPGRRRDRPHGRLREPAAPAVVHPRGVLPLLRPHAAGSGRHVLHRAGGGGRHDGDEVPAGRLPDPDRDGAGSGCSSGRRCRLSRWSVRTW